jgi:CHAD domain-containing protein
MSYRLKSGENISKGIKRIALEQIDQALRDLTDSSGNRDEAIHDARKCFKKIRAVLRLVRKEIGEQEYKQQNICFRDAGRKLSDVRDSAVLIETLDKLTDRFREQIKENEFAEIRTRLIKNHEDAKKRSLEGRDSAAEVAAMIRDAGDRVRHWNLKNNKFLLIAPGLKKIYRSGQKQMSVAFKQPNNENFHEWRKRVKYHWYHVRILQDVWSNVMEAVANSLHELSDILGDEHDLVTLSAFISEESALSGQKMQKESLLNFCKRRQEELRKNSRPLGKKIYLENPSVFLKRMDGYWKSQKL